MMSTPKEIFLWIPVTFGEAWGYERVACFDAVGDSAQVQLSAGATRWNARHACCRTISATYRKTG